MRAAFDSNVLVSGLVFTGGTPARLLDAWRDGRFVLVLSEPILGEIEGVLGRPKIQRHLATTPEERGRLILALRRHAVIVPGTTFVDAIRADPSDNALLAGALEGHVDRIVSGDRRHVLPLGRFRGIPVVAPAAFLRELERGGGVGR